MGKRKYPTAFKEYIKGGGYFVPLSGMSCHGFELIIPRIEKRCLGLCSNCKLSGEHRFNKIITKIAKWRGVVAGDHSIAIDEYAHRPRLLVVSTPPLTANQFHKLWKKYTGGKE